MGKKIIVVPPQAVSVNVSVTVGGGPATPAPLLATPAVQAQPPAVPAAPWPPMTQVNTSVLTGVHSGTELTAPFTPSFSMPASDVLRRKVPMLARREASVLGDHVHTAGCFEDDCALLSAQLPPKVTAKPWVAICWLLLAACVWVVQYSLVVPLAWLGAVAKSGGAKTVGWFAILLCGFGPFYSLFYAFSPHVPRHALRPWGLNKTVPPPA